MHRKNMLEIGKVVEKLILRLQSEGIINPNADSKELLDKTMENLKNCLGDNMPKGEELKDPMVLMKLTLSIVATHKNMDNPTQAIQLIDKIFQLQTPQQLMDLSKEMQLDIKMLKLMRSLLGSKKESLSDADPDKNVCQGLYDAAGDFIMRFANTYASSKGARILTVEEAESNDLFDANEFMQGMFSDVNSLATAPNLKPY